MGPIVRKMKRWMKN